MDNNNKEMELEALLSIIKDKGIDNEKPDVLGHIAIEDKVYVRRVGLCDKTRFKFATISSHNKDFKDVGIGDIRLNSVNRDGMWASVFATEASEETLSKIVEMTKNLYGE